MCSMKRKGCADKMGVVNNIKDLRIDSTLPKKEKIKSYLEQMENPYEYQDEGTKVRIRFADTQETLTDRLIAYASSKAVL